MRPMTHGTVRGSRQRILLMSPASAMLGAMFWSWCQVSLLVRSFSDRARDRSRTRKRGHTVRLANANMHELTSQSNRWIQVVGRPSQPTSTTGCAVLCSRPQAWISKEGFTCKLRATKVHGLCVQTKIDWQGPPTTTTHAHGTLVQ